MVCEWAHLSPQDTQSTCVGPEDSASVILDDTSSHSSVAADTEEDRRSALEKSMYVFHEGFFKSSSKPNYFMTLSEWK